MAQSDSSEHLYSVAVIGLTGRFPGANTIEAFWDNLCNGVESISHFSDQELERAGVDPVFLRHPDYVKASAILADIEQFDAAFFGFYPREAELLNPQHRLFLECAWEALEQVGYIPDPHTGRIGVYAGAGSNGYLSTSYAADGLDHFQVLVGNEKDFLATQVAYKLNLTGPSIAVQTACSTSLVAVHLAYQSLLNHECDMALAGGVTINTPQQQGYLYVEGGIASRDGHCRAFDAQAQGTVGGSGVGIVVLKRLADALADGDRVLAVIKGSAINNDGAMKVGFTAPSLEGQAEVITDALAMADVDPETITYIETHGTGTALGDPIEIGALNHAFRSVTQKTGFCKIGAVKTNMGHLDAAAGVTGLIKTVLALHHQLLPPTLHFKQPNPKIDFANSPFTVNTTLTPWESHGQLRRAGVSSFGIGGTNAHVILEEAPAAPATSSSSRPWQLLLLSARTPAALETMTGNLLTHLRQHPELLLADVAYTLQVGRKRFDHSRLLVCQSLEEAVAALDTLPPDQVLTSHHAAQSRPVVFMFSGQGAQYPDMGRDLYRHEPVFRAIVDKCAAHLAPILGLDIRQVIYPDQARRKSAAEQLSQTALTQPALFIVEYALAELCRSWGIEPQAMIGHSIGEYVAACVAGVFGLEDALTLVATRGRMMQELPAGDMLAVPLAVEDVQPFLDESPSLSLAAVNGATQCVLSGSVDEVASLASRLSQQGIKTTPLHTSHAFHSEMMAPMLEPFIAAVTEVTLNPPRIPYLSNLTGTWMTAAQATDPAYWAKHVRHTVRFTAGLGELVKEPDWILLEVGPGTTLRTLAQQYPGRDAGQTVLASLPHAQDPRPAMRAMLQTLGQLWSRGSQVDWLGFYAAEQRRRVGLPTYPFERQRYWIDAPPVTATAPPAFDDKLALNDWFSVPSWRRSKPLICFPQVDLSEQMLSWLVFVDAGSLSRQLVQCLQEHGQTVITVMAGEAFHQHDERTYTLNPGQLETYNALFKALKATAQLPSRLVYMWSVTPIEAREANLTHFYSLLFLAQAVGEANVAEPIHLAVISSEVQAVTGSERLIPEKATLIGPCRVIPQEYPLFNCRSIDVVVPTSDGPGVSQLVNQLVAELSTAATEAMVAYRGPHRWVQSFEPAALGQGASRLRHQGVYLLTEGLSDTGLALAHYLAQTVQAKLILVDSATFPAKAQWLTWPHEDETSRKIEQLQAIEALGSELLMVNAVVTDHVQLQAAVEQAQQRFGQLHGVLYISTARGSGLMQLKTMEMAQEVLDSRVTGTQVMERVLQGVPLDFLALFGSNVSITGGLGQVDECAANTFLDAYVHGRGAQAPYQVVAIDWAGWAWDDHFEQLMADVPSMQEQAKLLRELYGITPQEAGEALERILSSGEPQIIVSTQDLQDWIDQQNTLTSDTFMDQMDSVQPLQSLLDENFEAPANETEERIAEIWQEVFGVPRIGRHDNFFDLGGHSLLAIQLVSRTRDVLQMDDLPLNRLFETPTVAGLAAFAATRQQNLADADELAALLQEIEGLSEDEIQAALLEEMQEDE